MTAGFSLAPFLSNLLSLSKNRASDSRERSGRICDQMLYQDLPSLSTKCSSPDRYSLTYLLLNLRGPMPRPITASFPTR